MEESEVKLAGGRCMDGLHGVADPMGLGGRMGLGRRREAERFGGHATRDEEGVSYKGGWGAKMQGRGTNSHGSSISSGSSQRQTGVVRQPGSITHCPVLLPRYTAWRDAQPSLLGRLCVGQFLGRRLRTSSRMTELARIHSRQSIGANHFFHGKCSSVRRWRP